MLGSFQGNEDGGVVRNWKLGMSPHRQFPFSGLNPKQGCGQDEGRCIRVAIPPLRTRTSNRLVFVFFKPCIWPHLTNCNAKNSKIVAIYYFQKFTFGTANTRLLGCSDAGGEGIGEEKGGEERILMRHFLVFRFMPRRLLSY
jgi:hypothetical protein